MSDDLNKKIKQIGDALGQENMPENLKGLLSLLAGSLADEGHAQKSPEPQPEKREVEKDNSQNDSTEMMRKIKTVMDSVNVNSDPRVLLLNSLKPFLGNTRQKRLNACIKMISMTKLMRLMDDGDNNIL